MTRIHFPCRRLFLAAVLLADPGAHAAQSEWTALVSGETPTVFSPVVARPLPDGGALVSGQDTQGHTWTIRLDADLRARGATRHAHFARAPLAAFGDQSIAAIPFATDSLYQPDAARLCALQRGWLALDVRTFNEQLSPGVYGLDPARFELDAAGGHYGAYWQDEGIGLARFGLDCRREDIPGLYFTWDTVAVPNARAAYAIGEERNAAGQELIRVADGQIVWRYAPEPALEPRFALFPAAPDGDALLRLVTVATPKRWFVERWRAAGQRRWLRELEPGRLVRQAIAVGADTLLLEGAESQLQVDTLRLLDATGAERWHAAASAPYYAGVLGDARDAGGTFVRLQRDLRDAGQGFDLVRIANAGPTVHALPAGIHPWLVLPDGSLLATDHGGTHRTLQQRFLDRPEVRDLPLALPHPVELGAVKRLQDGALLATRMEDGRTRVNRYRADGALGWTRLLPAVAGYFASSQGSGPDYLFATDAARVCLWQLDEHVRTSHIACLRSTDGASLFDWVPATHREGAGARVLSLAADGSVHASGGGCLFDGNPVCRRSVHRLTLAGDGSVLSRQEVHGVPGANDAFGFVAGPEAQRLAIQDMTGGSVKLTMREPNGSVRWSQSLAVPLMLLQLDASGRLLTLQRAANGGPARLSLLAPDGQPVWRRDLPEDSVDDGAQARILADGGALLIGVSRMPAIAYAARLDSNGLPLWQRRAPHTPQRFRYLERLAVAETGGFFVRQSFDYSHGDRLVAYRIDDGSAVDGVATPPSAGSAFFSAPPLKFDLDPAGRLALAVEEPDAGRVRVESLRLASPDEAAGAASEPLLGMWYALDTAGQGFFFDHDAGSGTTFGAWFTFAAGGGHDPAQLRWFTLVARDVPGAAQIDFDLMRNDGGKFAAGPATSASPVGTATLRRTDCDAAMLEYRFDAGIEGGIAGEIPLRRLAPAGMGCSGQQVPAQVLASRAARSGAWYAPEQSGQGLVFDFHPAGETRPGHFSAAWFTYDAQPDDPAAQHWFTLAGPVELHDAPVEVPIYRTLGGSLDAEPSDNTWRVGSATLRFDACDRVRLDYRFDHGELAHDYAGRTGTLALRRLGACPP